MRVYIAGPIAGHPDANRAAFAATQTTLERVGHVVVNPHDVTPHQHDGDCPPGLPGGEGAEHAAPCYMRTDLAAMLGCDAIYLLPGWQKSEGARIEYLIAVHVCGLDVLNTSAFLIPEPPRSVRVAFGLTGATA